MSEEQSSTESTSTDQKKQRVTRLCQELCEEMHEAIDLLGPMFRTVDVLDGDGNVKGTYQITIKRVN